MIGISGASMRQFVATHERAWQESDSVLRGYRLAWMTPGTVAASKLLRSQSVEALRVPPGVW